MKVGRKAFTAYYSSPNPNKTQATEFEYDDHLG